MEALIKLAGIKDYDGDLKRLAKLQGSDPAFFVLAVHSFIERQLRALVSLSDPADDRFSAFIDELRRTLIGRATGYIEGLEVLNLLKVQHLLTNEARHRFASATPEDARAATQSLRRFCALIGMPDCEGLRSVEEYLKAWEDRRSHGSLLVEIGDAERRLELERRDSKEMAARVAKLESLESELGGLREEIRRRDRDIEELGRARESKAERIAALREEKRHLAEGLREAQERIAEFEDARAYFELLSRLTVLSRSRADYERSLTRLTAEQSQVLDLIKLDADFLIKGAAGTGKTLVLLKAIEKAKGKGARTTLSLPGFEGSVALLTYTTTLVKYDGYVSSVLSAEGGADRIQTADSFILERLRDLVEGAEIDYGLIKELSRRHAPEGARPQDLAAEAEEFIWANDLRREQYVDEMIERRGMKKQLPRADRELYWEACEAMAAEMEVARRYSKGYSRVRLLRAAAAAPERLKVVDYVFVDEAQDLTTADLKVLKSCAKRSVVLAGDADQSIYLPGFAFRSAKVDIAGRTKILHTNFRNTLPIHELAERYRGAMPQREASNCPEAFRDGPRPELFTGADRSELLDLLSARLDFIVRRLGYEPGNVAVLVPLGEDVGLVRDRLSSAGYETTDIRDKDFDFRAEGAVRVSTLHSAKGLDFPVVLLLLYRPPYFGSGYDETTAEAMTRNLVYVAMTRAMDELSVFTLEEPGSAAVRELKASFLG